MQEAGNEEEMRKEGGNGRGPNSSDTPSLLIYISARVVVFYNRVACLTHLPKLRLVYHIEIYTTRSTIEPSYLLLL